MVVMVEALGAPNDQAAAEALFAPLLSPEIHRRYEVRRGTVPFFGSTTAAEMRELCGRTDSYLRVLGGELADLQCLPERLTGLGYDTVSFHGFSKTMFDRQSWYPTIGIRESLFREDLPPGFPICEGVWTGACDQALADLVQDRLVSATRPTMAYWLTLNTHVPIPPERRGDGRPCAAGLDDEQGCGLLAIWRELFGRVATLALAPAMPPTAILVVGDHAPPLFSRQGRAFFASDRVPWIVLTPR